MRLYKTTKALIFGILLLTLVLNPARVFAAFGDRTYGECPYSESCAPPVVLPPDQPSQPEQPSDDNGNASVSRDVDDDGNKETATDANGDSEDGYETFNDDDASSELVTTLDGDDDGKTDFIIDTDGDGLPERYWDPDNDVLSTVQLVQCDQDEAAEISFDNGTEIRIYDLQTGQFITECASPNLPGNTDDGQGSQAADSEDQPDESSYNRVTKSLLSNNPVYQSVGNVIKKVPAPVAYGFPYLLLLLILLLAIRLIIQSKREIGRIVVANNTIETEKRLALEKQNFMMLSSHYLRTPITVARGNIELMQSLKQITDDVATTLNNSGKVLLDQVSSILARIESDKQLASIQPSQQTLGIGKILSPMVLLPIISVVALIMIAHFLFIDFRVTQPNIIDFLVQIALGVLLVQLFVSKFRQRQLNRVNRKEQERILEEQRALDSARSQFIEGVANNLEKELNEFKTRLASVIDKPEAQKVKNALSQLASMIAKFRLVAYLQGQILEQGKVNFGFRDLITDVENKYAEAASSKSINVSENINDGQLYQQKDLLEIILRSLVDNAIKFSDEGGKVEIGAINNSGQAKFTVTDDGRGIDKSRQELLFKPFSRADSAETFNEEGLGFSLYLDKIIANYLGGDIDIKSEPGKGTTVSVTVPAAV